LFRRRLDFSGSAVYCFHPVRPGRAVLEKKQKGITIDRSDRINRDDPNTKRG
jgi:hypothetical protein